MDMKNFERKIVLDYSFLVQYNASYARKIKKYNFPGAKFHGHS